MVSGVENIHLLQGRRERDGEGDQYLTRMTPTHHPAETVRHARSKGAPVAGRTQHAVEHGQRSNVGGPAKGKEGQPNSPTDVVVKWTIL